MDKESSSQELDEKTLDEIKEDETDLEGANLHRFHEFEDIISRLDKLTEKIDVLKNSIDSLALDSGAVVTDDSVEDEELETEDFKAIEDLDFSL